MADLLSLFLSLTIVDTPEMMFFSHVLSFFTSSLQYAIKIIIRHQQAVKRIEWRKNMQNIEDIH